MTLSLSVGSADLGALDIPLLVVALASGAGLDASLTSLDRTPLTLSTPPHATSTLRAVMISSERTICGPRYAGNVTATRGQSPALTPGGPGSAPGST